MPVTIDDETYLQLILARGAGTLPPQHKISIFWSLTSLVVVAVLVILAIDHLFPGAVGGFISQRLGATPQATIATVPTTTLVAAPVGSQGYSQQAPVIQRVEVPIVQTVLVVAPEPSPVPPTLAPVLIVVTPEPPPPPIVVIATPTTAQGITFGLDGGGVHMDIDNGAPPPTPTWGPGGGGGGSW